MKFGRRSGGWFQFLEIITVLISLEYLVSCRCERAHRKRHSHNHHYHNSNRIEADREASSDVNNRRIVIGGIGGRADWAGQVETTCSIFPIPTNGGNDDLSNSNTKTNSNSNFDSKCSSLIPNLTGTEIGTFGSSVQSQMGAGDDGRESDFWCSSDDKTCSIIYTVETGTKIKNVFIHGLVDTRGDVLIVAGFRTDRHNVYQLGRLQGHDGEPTTSNHGLIKTSFQYVQDPFLEVAVLNVTLRPNGGLSIINNFTIILEEMKEVQHTEPVVEAIVLDIKNPNDDRPGPEWNEKLQTCTYSEYFQDFWAFGCKPPIDDSAMPRRKGFWYPCQEEFCSFVYDGSFHGKPKTVEINGYLKGGSISLAGKTHILDGPGWIPLETKILPNTTIHDITFDVRKACNINVLQILALPEKNSIILIDKITVHVDPHHNSSYCPPLADTDSENANGLEVSYRTSSGTGARIPILIDCPFLLLLCVILWFKE